MECGTFGFCATVCLPITETVQMVKIPFRINGPAGGDEEIMGTVVLGREDTTRVIYTELRPPPTTQYNGKYQKIAYDGLIPINGHRHKV